MQEDVRTTYRRNLFEDTVELDIYQLDAFASRVFEGNPAAVCPLESWPDDSVMQKIAAENNLPETAFFVAEAAGYRIRWFTPAVEVDLCGHATLASAWVLMHALGHADDAVHFASRSGMLHVRRRGDVLEMDFPSRPPRPCVAPEGLLAGLGLDAAEVLEAEDYLVVVAHEDIVAGLTPDFGRLKGLPNRGVAVTAPGTRFDFVSRWFGPNVGVDEDAATGSAHTTLAPYWAQRLGKTTLSARQGGRRRGQLQCEMAGDRVLISGSAVLYMRGVIRI